MEAKELEKKIFAISGKEDFEALALHIFRYQAVSCPPYGEYISLLGVDASAVSTVGEIPFLPIEFFKSLEVYSGTHPAALTFTSSGTTGAQTSRHQVYSPGLYEQSFTRGFRHFYGPAERYSIFALLPAYLERAGSSLIYMVEALRRENPGHGGFYLYDHDKLAQELRRSLDNGEKILLIGVTFALMDFAEKCSLDLHGAIVMETGGMKGRRQEVERAELHSRLSERLNVQAIHSEYGMTELLSQAYSRGGGVFFTPPWMRVVVRDLQNPLRRLDSPAMGGVDIIDLANLYSCSFISTGDRGTVYADGGFEIHGRIEGQQLRGCNMLV